MSGSRTPLSRSERIELYQLIAQIIGIIIVLCIAYIQFFIKKEIDNIASSIDIPFAVTSPEEGSTIGEITFVSGVSDQLASNHYVIVVPKNGIMYVQNSEPLTIERGKYWSTVANIGESVSGCEQPFQIFILATSENLPIGKLPDLPDDAVISPRTTVLRSACSENPRSE